LELWRTLAALGTVGALIVALAVFRRQVLDNRRAQASRIILTPGKSELDKSNPDALREEVQVHNYSDLPIYLGLVMLGEQSTFVPTVDPRADVAVWFTTEEAFESGGFLFQDASGRFWERSFNGRLHRYLENVHGKPWTGCVKNRPSNLA
jgi:hypothetical protein